MTKFLIILCALVACTAATPGLISAPFAAAPFPAAAVNAPLDAAYASSRLDIQQKYGAALFAAAPAKLVASAPVAAPLAAPVAAAPIVARLAAPISAPLAYTNLPLDAAYASSRLDIQQNYGAALVRTAFATAPTKLVAPAPVAAPVLAPLAAGPAKLLAPAPVATPLGAPIAPPLATAPAKLLAAALVAAPLAYTNLPLDAAYASSRLDIQQNYGAALLPTAFAAAPAKLIAAAPVAAPLAAAPAKLLAAAPVAAPLAAAVPAPLAYSNLPLDSAYASSRLDIQRNYRAALVPTTFAAAPAKLIAPAPAATPLATPVAAPLAAPVSAPIAYSNLPLDSAYASSRLDIQQKYGAALVPTAFAAGPAKLVASAPVPAPIAPVAPLKYTAASPALW